MWTSVPASQRKQLYLFLFTLLVFLYAIVVNAWVVDDAYITFRTVDNFVHGYGLTWNVDERVQVYTHPLWMFVISFFYLLTSEVFFTSIAVSVLCSVAAVLVASASLTRGFKADLWKLPTFVIALLSSKAFIDYTSSGLENPLSYLIAAVFYGRYMPMVAKAEPITIRALPWFFLLASLAFVNRQDTILLYLPALLHMLFALRSCPLRQLAFRIVLATLPAVLWLLFSLFYYGFAFPNTAYAKVFGTGFPFYLRIVRGMEYTLNSLCWDGPCYVMLAAAIILCWKAKSVPRLLPVAGVLLYLAFVVLSGASATHMSGRFFAAALFIVIFVLIDRIERPKHGLALSLLLIGYMAVSPLSALKFGTPAYHPYSPMRASYIDAKWFVLKDGAALLNWRPGRKLPDHAWYRYGAEFREQPGKVHVGGPFGGDAIGYMGFAAGPEKFILDRVALSDPLLARLPAKRPNSVFGWKSGHFHREIPEGYVESVARDENLVNDPHLHLYYEKLRNITRGRLLSVDRLRDVVSMNLGRYNYLLEKAAE